MFQFKRHCDAPTVTTASLEISTFLVLFSFVSIFVIIGLSVWVTKLTKRLRELEGQRLRNEYQCHNSGMHPFVYEINSQSMCSTQQPTENHKSSATLKVLTSKESSSSEDLKSNYVLSTTSNCGQCGKFSPQLVRLSSIKNDAINQNSSFR